MSAIRVPDLRFGRRKGPFPPRWTWAGRSGTVAGRSTGLREIVLTSPFALQIRPERPEDAAAIRAVTQAAFRGAAHSSQTEASIVEALRAAGALTVSLVAIQGGEVVGHVAFSPVRIDGPAGGWQGLGPLSVRPDRQRRGIGEALVRDGLERLRAMKSAGCVVLGDPGYYGRFGFGSDPQLYYGGVPPGYLQSLAFEEPTPQGEVHYHPGFDAS